MVPSRKLAHSAVALAEVVGTIPVEMPARHNFLTHGRAVFWLVKVSIRKKYKAFGIVISKLHCPLSKMYVIACIHSNDSLPDVLLTVSLTHVTAGVLPEISASLNSSNKWCPKCGTTNKSGKVSCCARGGSWFKNCGDEGNTKFDHTWAEGVQACKDIVSSVSVQLSPEVMFRHAGATMDRAATTKPQSVLVVQQQTDIPRTVTATRDGVTNGKDCVDLTTAIVVYICVSLTVWV